MIRFFAVGINTASNIPSANAWGGVRGGISLALILAVANIPALAKYSDILVGYTFICVLLSGVVCGLGLPEVLNAFYYNPNEPKHVWVNYTLTSDIP